MSEPVYAKCSFRDGGLFAEEFGDVYFSAEGAPAESLHVFVEGNDLPARFSDVALREFTILETGFGTGLNFLQAGRTFLEHAPQTAVLRYVSIEKYPISPEILSQVFSRWDDDFAGIKNELLEKYSAEASPMKIGLAGDRINLEVHFADVLDSLDSITAWADAIFLDGFAPDRNPQMWEEPVMRKIAAHSKAGLTTVATFTAAGSVKKALRAAGFEIKRYDGFGKKWHMIAGVYGKACE